MSNFPSIPEPHTNPTLRIALELYRDRISILKKGYQQEKYRIDQLLRHPLAEMPIKEITTVDIAKYRDERQAATNSRTGKPVATSTVRLDLALLSDLFRIAMIEWGYCHDNPVLKVRKPKIPPGRDRRLAPREEKLIRRHCAKWKLHEMDTIVTIALETAMRQGEILKLTWENVNLRNRIARLPDTKNGTTRDVPLTLVARDALVSMVPKSSGRVFKYSGSGFKSSWRGTIKSLKIENLHFHDLRHEAASRLFERGTLDMMEIAAITGHKSLSMLKRYTHLRAQKLVRKLEAGTSKSKAAVLTQLIPYPAVVTQNTDGSFTARLLDFGQLSVSTQCKPSAIHAAQDTLLRRIMTGFRTGEPLPAPDHFLDQVNESEVVWIDPLARCEANEPGIEQMIN